ncbi:short-chain dehydrogenase/reductase SDR [Parafrankia sp. EAN1pec]|nr:short-chain dehydrogenase/reductase SDR [Frankia sp. EAN1pec]
MAKVQGKVAFVTGAGRGLGRSFAARLAEEGADIIATDVCSPVSSAPYGMASSSDLDQTVAEVRALGRHAVAFESDVRDGESIQAGLAKAVVELGRLDIVCANAGFISYGAAVDLAETEWNEMIDVHVTGAWNTCKAAVPYLIRSGVGASIVFTSSMAGLRARPGIGHYVTAKHAVVGLMRTFAIELAPFGVRVNSVHPTSTNTQMIQNSATRQVADGDGADGSVEERRKSGRLLDVPWIEAIDVANAVLFLSSEDARYITGVTLPIDAGAMLV